MERTVGAHSINLLFTSIFVEFPFCAGACATGHAAAVPAAPTVGVRRSGMTMTSYFPMADALTSREREITSLASVGLSNKEVAQHLNISEATVKIHLHNIFRKLGVNNRTALAARYRASRQANGHADELVDAQRGQPGEAIKRARSVA
jgi:DNA-binding CsgD family transcriptional regulator